MNTLELRDLDDDGLRAREQELDDQLFRMRVQQSLGQLESPASVRKARRELARVKTILREKAK